MAQLELILQAATDATHAKYIHTLLGIGGTDTLISVAFVREAGVEALEASLKPRAAHTKFFVGIRNNITTIQAVKRLLALKAEVYAVDTSSGDTIFHPKLYLTWNDQQALLIVGSANMTFQGLYNNIEVSTLVRLQLDNDLDRVFVENTLTAFGQLVKDYPQHVFLIKDEKHAEELFLQGRLGDETIVPAPTSTSGVRKGARDPLPRMKLRRVFRPCIKLPVRKVAKKVSAAIAANNKPGFWSCTFSAGTGAALGTTALDAIGIIPGGGNVLHGVQLAAGVGALGLSLGRASFNEAAAGGAITGLAFADAAHETENIAIHGVEVVPIAGNVVSALATANDIFGKEGVIASYKACFYAGH